MGDNQPAVNDESSAAPTTKAFMNGMGPAMLHKCVLAAVFIFAGDVLFCHHVECGI